MPEIFLLQVLPVTVLSLEELKRMPVLLLLLQVLPVTLLSLEEFKSMPEIFFIAGVACDSVVA